MKATINFQDALKDLTRIKNKEIPYAVSLGINDTAFAGRKSVQKNLGKKFDLKSKWAVKGVRVQKSSKRQTVQSATVYHVDDYMEDHEDGGVRRPKRGSNKLLVKTKTFRGRSARVSRSKSPSALLSEYKGPRAAGKMGGRGNRGKGRTKWFKYENSEYFFIARRKNRSKKARRDNLIYAYFSLKKAKYGKRMHFKKTVTGVAKNVGPRMIAKHLNRLS